RSGHLIGRSEELPHRMGAEEVIERPDTEFRAQHVVFGGSNLAMMPAHLFGERPRRPALHSRGDDGDVIDSSGLDGNITADRLEAGAAEYLARAGDVLDADEPVVVREPVL